MIDWDGVFAHVSANTGWTWDQVEQQLDLHRLSALNREWARHPPVHHLVAGYLGYKGPSNGQTTLSSPELDQFASMGHAVVGSPKLDTSAWDSRHITKD